MVLQGRLTLGQHEEDGTKDQTELKIVVVRLAGATSLDTLGSTDIDG